MNGQKLEEATSFKFLGSTLCKGGNCSAEIHTRIASATAAMARLNRIWRCNTISFASKFKLYKSLFTSILLYGCEPWTLLADSHKKIQSFETKCLKKFLSISYLEHKISDWVRSKINFLVGPHEPFLTTVKRWKLAWFGHVTRHDSLSKTSFRHFGGWPMPWSAEEMLAGQHGRVDIPAHARSAHNGLLLKRLERDLC